MSDAEALVVVADDPKYDTDRLREVPNCRVESADLSTPAALREHAANADAVVVNVDVPIAADVLADLDLSVVVRGAVGVDGIDMSAAADHGVQVVRVPEYCLEEVADHAVGLLTALARGIPAYADRAASGEWGWEPPYPVERLADCTVGVVSFGPIARLFTDRVSPLVDDVLVADPYVDAAVLREHDAERVSFDALCRRADHISVHAPLTEETRGMVGADAFESLPAHAVVVNTGRGGVVDEGALATAPAEGSVAAAGLDVLESEPPAADHPLLDRDDVLVTPHAGWYSAAAERDLDDAIADDLARAFRDEEPRGLVESDADWL